ncbi:MAG: FIST N-terminal domain-containing protein, partial [Campylobacterota bacterium]|nr:FIST N-terminal domain-containing protein [Campylobacterota bacterium]
MKTFNTHYSTLEALQSFILENVIEDSSSLLIQVFTAHNNKSYIESLLKDINYIFSKAVLIGSTTDGEICNGEVSTMSTVISFTQFEKTQLDVYSDSGNDCYFDAGKKLASTIIKPDSKAVIAFIDGLNGNGEEFLKGISSINSTVVIAGGMAGDNAQFEVSYVFTKTDIMDNGVVGVSLSSEYLHVMSDYSFHWLRVGKELSITKAEKNRVYQINNLSAYDTYAHYLGTNIAEKLPAVGIEFPLIINRDGVDIARAVIGKEDDGSLIFAGNLHEGDRVNFGYGDSDSILSHAHKHCAHIQKYPVESLFIYSCMARRRFMPHDIDKEIKPLNSIAPTSGFFTYGEFFSASHNELLNQTMTILALSESDNIHTKIALDTIQEEHSETMQALAHLINISSSELISQNERQTRIYKRLHYIGQQVNEQLEIDELYNIAVNFANNELNFEKCLIFEHDDYNGWFKVKKSIGYESPIEKQ